jgi:hypothetical protein
MTRKLRPLAALTDVALFVAGGSYSFAAQGDTGSKRSSSAPGTLPPMGSAGSKRALAPGTLPPMRPSRSKPSSAPGKLPPTGCSR